MDFPLTLEKKAFVQGKDELEQVIYISLSQDFGTILHDEKKGTNISVHMMDQSALKLHAEVTLSRIQGLTLKSIQLVDYDNMEIVYEYEGNLEKYNYYLS